MMLRPLVSLVSLLTLLPDSGSEPSIKVPHLYSASTRSGTLTSSMMGDPGVTMSSPSPGIFSLPLTESLEHAMYNSSKGVNISIPANYSRHSLPSGVLTRVNIGIDIKDIPQVNDQDFSITLNGFFLVRWVDNRLQIRDVTFGAEGDDLVPVDISLVQQIWIPDVEILNLKEFKTLDVLSKLEGLWLNRNLELIYAVACRIIWICPMTFDNFPLDVQHCQFQVGSFNYDVNKMVFKNEFVADSSVVRSVLDYTVDIGELSERHRVSVVLTGNYSVSGFELKLTRKMAFYIITYYFPTGMFVIVSWISFLVPPESVPGRMTILVTVFLCLVNIFNSITNKIPKADGLTAIEAFIIICIIFVFGALMEYATILFRLKIRTAKPKSFQFKNKLSTVREIETSFKRYDVNGSGRLTKSDMQRANEFTLHEIDAIFETGDVNGDGEIDLPEFVELMIPDVKEAEEEGKQKAKQVKDDVEDKVGTARMDLFFFVLFPILFTIFNVIYWIVFMYRAGAQERERGG